jgi:predicted Fe-Mo cluster-binding NifX family protein
VFVKRLAFATDDGETITRHLGHAPYYVVVSLAQGGPPACERRPKPHSTGEHHASGEGHGHGHGRAMFEPIADCQVLIAGGLGRSAYEHAVARGPEVILIGEKRIDWAVEAYQAGALISDPRRIHARPSQSSSP